MGLITGGQFTPIADRLAKQAILAENAVNESRSGTSYYVRVHQPLPSTGDYQIEADLITPANTTDTDVNFTNVAQTLFSDLIPALESHVVSRGSAASITDLDGYLSKSGINVHELFGVAYAAIQGTDLDAVNVFRDDEVEFGFISVTSSGVGTFTDGTSLGTGSGAFVRKGGTGTVNSAEALVKYHVGLSGISGGEHLVVNVIGTNEQGNTVSAAATINAGTAAGTESGIGLIKILNMTTVQFAGGASGDVVRFRSMIERGVGL